MRVVFRADASSSHGTGHVMRCLALADLLVRSEVRVEFISRHAPGGLTNFISQHRGYPVHELPQDCNPMADAAFSLELLDCGEQPDWLVVDHYGLSAEWQRHLRPYVGRIMVIDDLADRVHDCDLLLDQNLQASELLYDGLVPDDCIKLLGPTYALLRPEFADARSSLTRQFETVDRILISFGGSDPTNETTKALTQLQRLEYSDHFRIDCVIGHSHAAISEVSSLVETMPNVKLHVQAANMAQLMSEADLGFGAGGSTTWERCCLGLPTMTVTVSANQEPFGRPLGHLGYSYYLGNIQEEEVHYAAALQRAIEEPETRQAMSRKCMTLVDGRGAERVAAYMLEET